MCLEDASYAPNHDVLVAILNRLARRTIAGVGTAASHELSRLP